MTKIEKKNYYFSKKGVLQKKLRPFLYNKKYYVTNRKGVMSQVDDLEGQASVLTRKFIEAHTKTSESAAAKLKKCFNWLIANIIYDLQTEKE